MARHTLDVGVCQYVSTAKASHVENTCVHGCQLQLSVRSMEVRKTEVHTSVHTPPAMQPTGPKQTRVRANKRHADLRTECSPAARWHQQVTHLERVLLQPRRELALLHSRRRRVQRGARAEQRPQQRRVQVRVALRQCARGRQRLSCQCRGGRMHRLCPRQQRRLPALWRASFLQPS